MKKALLIFFLFASVIFSLCACGDEPPVIDDGNDDFIDAFDAGYTLVYNKFNSAEADIAEELVDQIDEITNKEMQSIGFNESAEYEIQFGTLMARDECAGVIDELGAYRTADIEAYALRVVDGTVIVCATSPEGLQIASEKFLTYLKDGKLLIPKDLNEVYVFNAYRYDLGFLEEYKASDIASIALLSSISVADTKILSFASNECEYTAYYSSTDIVPTISAMAISKDAEVSVLQPAENDGVAKIVVTSKDGSTTLTYTVNMAYGTAMNVDAEVVNKGGASGVVSFVFDDGVQSTADLIATRILPKYSNIRLSYAVMTKYLATLSLNGEEWLKDNNGKYVYEDIKRNTYNSEFENSIYNTENFEYVWEFWKSISERDGVEILSHSHTHSEWGLSDSATYDKNGNLIYPNGNVSKELFASQQILRDLCSEDALVYVAPGVGECTGDSADYYHNLIKNSGIYIAARITGSSPLKFEKALSYAENFDNPNRRFGIYSYAVKNHSTQFDETTDAPDDFTTDMDSSFEECIAAGIPIWKNYIDVAIQNGGWACYCIHRVVPDGAEFKNDWSIYESQLDQLFAYAQTLSENGDIWIPTITEGAKYFTEWSSAVVTATVNGEESVTVSVTDSEDDDIYDMALTVRVSVPRSWSTATAEGTELEVHTDENGAKYVYVNVLPDSESLTITK